MAEKITLELEAKLGDAVKRLDGIEKQLIDVGKESKNASKGIGGMKKALSGVGAVLTGGLFKAGAVIFEKLTELFMSNQTVVDTLSTAMNGLKIVFNDLVGFLTNVSLPTFSELYNSIRNGFVKRFHEAIEVLGIFAEAVGKAFTGDFKGALESIKEAGKESIDIITGQDKSFEKVKESITSYGKEVLKTADNQVKLNKQAQLAEAQNARLLQQYDRDAELQRQIRDDVSLTIEERIAANVELGRILDEQQKTMMDNAQQQVDAAQAALAIDKDNLDLQIALINAQTELIDVEAHVTGLRAEQLTNTNSLLQEQKDLEDEAREKKIEDQDAEDARSEKLLQDKIDQAQLEENLKNQKIQGIHQAMDAVAMAAGSESKIAKALFLVKTGMIIKEQIAAAKATLGRITTAAAESGVDGAKGLMKAATAAPPPANVPLIAIMAGQVAAIAVSIGSAVNAAKSSVSKVGGVGGGGGMSAPATPAAPPAFNVVGAAPENQLAVALGENEQQPVKAFVVSNDVTNAQALDRNIVEQASIG